MAPRRRGGRSRPQPGTAGRAAGASRPRAGAATGGLPYGTAAPAWLSALGPPQRLVLAVLIASYAAIYVTVTMIKYRFYLYTDFDLALFTQAADLLRHGSTWNTVRGMDWRADHSSLSLYLIAPLTWLFPPAPALLVLQSLVLALGAWPVYRLARRLVRNETIAVICAALYLCHPAIGYTNLFEFHPETLSTTTLLFALDGLYAGAIGRTLLFAGLSLLGKEDIAVAVLGLAALALTRPRPRAWWMAAGLASLAAISLAITFLWLKPSLGHGEIDPARMYGLPASGARETVWLMLGDPWRTIASLWMTPDNPADSAMKQQFYMHLLLPLGFLPLLGPAPLLLGALPVVAQHFISDRAPQHSIVHQYTAVATPFVVAATVVALARLRRWGERSGRGLALAHAAAFLALAASLAANVMFGPLLGHRIAQRYTPTERWWPGPKDALMRPYRDRMTARVPDGVGVVASFEYLPRLAARANVHSFHHLFLGHYMLSDKPYPVPDGIGAVLSTFGDQYDEDAAGRLHDLIARNDLHPVDGIDDLLLLLRGAKDTLDLMSVAHGDPAGSVHVVYDDALTLAGADLPLAPCERGGLAVCRTYWRRHAPVDGVYLTLLALIDGAGHQVLYRTRYLGYGLATPDRWPADTTMRETYRLGIPRTIPPGRYRLVMQVARRKGVAVGYAHADDPQLNGPNRGVGLGVVEVR